MFTRTTNLPGALVTAIVVLTGVVLLPRGAAAADPNADDHFLALLDQKGIPALDNAPSLIAIAHRVCGQLDGGMGADAVVDDMRERAFKANPAGGQYPADRVTRTIARFISAAVEAYCPNNQAKVASLEAMANPVPGANTYKAASSRSELWESRSALHMIPLGETGLPEPPQLPPPPPPPTAQIMTPPLPVATPSPRQQPPPTPQQPLPGPQQEPPAGPAPASPPGTGGGAGADSPATPPGRVQLAP
ncbi:DUF732 domain-containing protein [Mycobacterium sp. SMC-2]|uniref:DUF732 domain-containing protein n=1 Tax=Mycobacterium sp. SMC-2 TaxID=2857058 RepID=UPI0021B20985|nr:DUF732 domain-containing protein [Mycobacterium sp. SMC-2]UXA07951.1 DUF732 domain-containing protein [Mycobacterium sp. SMC-2]